MKERELFVVAGEESANQYALKLLKTFKKDEKYKNLKFSGIGFESLVEDEFELVYDASKLSVMGAFEVLKKWKTVKEAFDRSLSYIKKHKPKAVLLIDFGGFNLKLAQKIKEEGLETKVLYFISPKFWAWGAKRVLKVKKFVDHMYVVHPFEVEFYKKWGVDVDFVGHPLLEELNKNLFDSNWKKQEKIIEGLDPDKKILGLLLGSRPSEIIRHKEPFCAAAENFLKACPESQIVFIAPPSRDADTYSAFLEPLGFEYNVLQDPEPIRKMALCDFALVASGTATLQMGLLGVPMVIGYFMNPVTMFLAKTFVKGVKYAGLVNIIKGEEVSKEFLQGDFDPEVVGAELAKFYHDPNLYLAKQKELLNLRDELGKEKTYIRLKNEIERFL